MAGQVWHYDKSLYEDIENISYSAWAWEFKRRDPKIIQALKTGKAIRPEFRSLSNGIGIFNLSKLCKIAEQFGLHFIPPPNLSPQDTVPFWLPEVMKFNFNASIEILDHTGHKDSVLHWKTIPGKKHILFSPLRRTKLTVLSNSYATQLAIEDHNISVLKSKYLSLKVGEKHLKQSNIIYLNDFSTHCQGQNTSNRHRRGFFPHNLKQALIALDGALNKATQREISSVLFGSKQTQFDWDNGIFSLKSRTRRLIKKGQNLMTHDYRELL